MSRKQASAAELPGTSFQLHIETMSSLHGWNTSNLADYTVHRLKWLAMRAPGAQARSRISQLLKAYQMGEVAIAWQGGQPVYHTIKADSLTPAPAMT